MPVLTPEQKMQKNLFSVVEEYVKANHGKNVLAVDPNTMPQGFILAYVGGEKEPYQVTKENIDKFLEARSTGTTNEPKA